MEIVVEKLDGTISQTHAGRNLVERVAREHYDLDDIEIELRGKKPCFVNAPLHFSISHSKDFVAACFDKNPVGFDIEYICASRNLDRIAKRYNLKSSDAKEVYSFWCVYEAEIKLGQPSADVKSFKLFDDYMAAIASTDKIGQVCVF